MTLGDRPPTTAQMREALDNILEYAESVRIDWAESPSRVVEPDEMGRILAKIMEANYGLAVALHTVIDRMDKAGLPDAP